MTDPGLADLARAALSALRADAVLVVDERGHGPRVVLDEGASGSGLCPGEVLPGLPATAGDAVVDNGRSRSGRAVRSTSLGDDAGRRIGTLHVLHDVDVTPPERLHAHVRAFARHLGVILQRRPRRAPDRTHVLPWDDDDGLSTTLDDVTALVSDVVRPLVGAAAVGITLWDPDRQVLRALPGAFGVGDGALAASVTGPVTNLLSTGSRVFATGQPYLSNDAVRDPGVLQPYAEVFRIHRILSVPLTLPRRRIGVLHLVNKTDDFTVADIACVEEVAPQIAVAVDLARSVGRMAAQQRLEAILTATAVAVASGRQVEDCLVPAFDRFVEVTGASTVALVPLTADPLLRRGGPPAPDIEERLLRDARALAATSTGAFPRRAGDPGWAALHAPVTFDGARAATLSVLRRNGEPFSPEESDVVVRLAGLVALAWTTERYQHQLAEIARLRERERIADGLHDRVAQILFAAQLGIDTVLESSPQGPSTERIVEVRDLLVHGDAAIRDVIHRLSNEPDASPARRIRLEVESVEDEFGVAVRVEIPDPDALATLPRPVADAVVKIVREGTVNAAKHAGPCRIGLDVRTERTDADDHRLVVTVVDDGLGAGLDGVPGRGLTSLCRTVDDAGGTLVRTRAGDGFGTRLVATFPL
ncbi:GAF domain-containing protein [Pseudonocardia sediminis]|uniref:GAF domain-containing protein n=1 Tax=Pseudonocardia sediminis TaxID=1397368 RepID=UPI0013EF3114|nr:GAF domain-containing protein [Pseudonocardia sediminis]